MTTTDLHIDMLIAIYAEVTITGKASMFVKFGGHYSIVFNSTFDI